MEESNYKKTKKAAAKQQVPARYDIPILRISALSALS
jgi:hypothetical protein